MDKDEVKKKISQALFDGWLEKYMAEDPEPPPQINIPQLSRPGIAGSALGGGGASTYATSQSRDLRMIERAKYVFSINGENDEFHIVKNRYGSTERLEPELAFKLIGSILSNSIFGNDKIMKIFSEGVRSDIIKKCEEVLHYHNEIAFKAYKKSRQ